MIGHESLGSVGLGWPRVNAVRTCASPEGMWKGKVLYLSFVCGGGWGRLVWRGGLDFLPGVE